MKRCSTCKFDKPLVDFNKYTQSKDGLQPRCRECQAIHNVHFQTARNEYKLLMRYGLTPVQYNEILKAQNGVCAICFEQPRAGKNLDVDHDHNCCNSERICGKCLRGLLCRRCNTALGAVCEDIDILQNMIAYVQESRAGDS